MRQMFPHHGEVDPIDAYGRLGKVGDRPSVRVNMVASVDGATTVDKRSGGLGGPADKVVFATLRSLTDVILVGAATMRTEGYGPANLSDAARRQRREWGLLPEPPIAVLTRTCQLDWDAPFFTQAEQRPVVITATSAATTDRARAAEVAEVILAGDDAVDLRSAVRALGERGYDNVLAEGGPAIAAQLASTDLIDELCLTVSPLLVGGDARRILHGDALQPPTPLELRQVLAADGYLFLRYQRA